MENILRCGGLRDVARHWLGERRKAEAAVCPTPEELAARYGEAVYAYAYRRVGSAEAAEDIAAETFAAAFQKIPALPQGSDALINPNPEHDPARAWLFGIARRKVADYLRGQERRREVALDAVAEIHSDAGSGPEAKVLQGEAADKVWEVLNSLAPDYREALLLKYAEQCPVSEVAAILGRSVAATDSLLQRARAAARAGGSDYFAEREEKPK